MVDFATPSVSMDSYYPIGVWLTSDDGVELKYRPEDEEEPSDNYSRTMGGKLGWLLDSWRGGEQVEWSASLVQQAGNDYLGLRFRTVSAVEDDATIESVYERFVLRGERLPEVELEELPGEYV